MTYRRGGFRSRYWAEDMPVYAHLERGLRIVVRGREHPPPHFHVDRDNQNLAAIDLKTLEITEGALSSPDRRIVSRWLDDHGTGGLLEEWDARNPDSPRR